MRAKSLLSLVLVIAAGAASFAGNFNSLFGGPCKIEITVPEPPIAYIGKKTAQLEVTTQFPDITADQLRTLIGQALAPDIAVTDSAPEAIFRINVITFDRPVTKQYTLNERRVVHVSDRPVYGKDGKQLYVQPVYEERILPVAYWEANGMISMTVDVKSSTGATLDVFTPQVNFNQKLNLSVGNESTPEAAHIPDQRQLVRDMTAMAAGQIRRRYATSQRHDSVMLAIDNELKAGNAMAKAGKWDEAIKQWDSVKMKKNESDRLYNIAVGNEMLAYSTYSSTQDMQAAYPLFAKAMDLYAKALQGDPTEKYIQQAQARIMRAKASMETTLKQYQAQRFEAEKLEQEIAAKRGREAEIAKMISDGAKDLPVADTPGEAKFRTYVRARMNTMPGDPTDDQISGLLNSAKDLYGVEGDAGRKVIYLEIGHKRKHDKGISLYRENLTEFARDKRVDADERSVLSDIKKQYSLADSETAALEQQAGIAPAAERSAVKPAQPATSRPIHKTVRSNP